MPETKVEPHQNVEAIKMRPISEILEFFHWAREQGAVHVKGEGFEAVWLPPQDPEDIVDGDPQFEEVSLKQWATAPKPPRIR